MSELTSSDTKFIKRAALSVGSGILALIGGCSSYQIVPSGSYGVDIKLGQLKSDDVKPGFYWKVPFAEQIYVLNNNTIILETDNVGGKQNSADRNTVSADFRTHYKVNPKVGSIALTIKQIEDDHGKEMFETLEKQALDAAVGSRNATDTLADLTGFLQAFKTNLQWRIAQNNLPIEIDSIELLTVYVGAGTDSHDNTSYGLRKVAQLRIRSNDVVEQMVGPSAVPVSAGGSTVTSSTVTTQKTTVVPGPTAATAPVTTSSKPPVVQPPPQ